MKIEIGNEALTLFIDMGEARKHKMMYLVTILAMAALLFLLSLVPIRLAAARISSPLERLARIAREVSAGNYSLKIKKLDNIKEISAIERSFNHMTAAIEKNISELQAARKDAEDAAATAELESARLRSMIEGMEEGVVVADKDDRVIEVNSWFLNTVGRKREEIIGKELWEFHNGESNRKLRSFINDYRTSKQRTSGVVVSNGKKALEALEREMFDLILMDIQMPEMDGLSATRIIREKEKQEGGHIPIVAMTAHAMKEDRERCLEAVMDGYLSKPIKGEELFTVIERIGSESGDN
jgi:PAS domain S-box-containing protein